MMKNPPVAAPTRNVDRLLKELARGSYNGLVLVQAEQDLWEKADSLRDQKQELENKLLEESKEYQRLDREVRDADEAFHDLCSKRRKDVEKVRRRFMVEGATKRVIDALNKILDEYGETI